MATRAWLAASLSPRRTDRGRIFSNQSEASDTLLQLEKSPRKTPVEVDKIKKLIHDLELKYLVNIEPLWCVASLVDEDASSYEGKLSTSQMYRKDRICRRYNSLDWIPKLEPSPPVIPAGVMEMEDITHDLKTMYMVDMAPLWQKSEKVDEDAGKLEVDDSDGPLENDIRSGNDFFEYLQLEIMPH